MFDRFIKHSREQKLELEEMYNAKCLEHLRLQEAFKVLEGKYTDAQIDIDSGVFLNNKRPNGNIYFGGEVREKGFETNMKPVFVSELGLYI